MPLDTGMEPSPSPWTVKTTSTGSVYIQDANNHTVAILGDGSRKQSFADAHYIVHLVNENHEG